MKFTFNKYQRRSIRLKDYDYASTVAYFVTICARNRECLFGSIQSCVGAGLAPAHDKKEHAITLSEAGIIVDRHWRNIQSEYNHVSIDEYVLMPNHLHGIIIIHSKKRATARVAPTLGHIIGSFKSKCVKDYLYYIRQNNLHEIGKLWQRNYYERIIRNEHELHEIGQYIQNNPAKWELDKENPQNL